MRQTMRHRSLLYIAWVLGFCFLTLDLPLSPLLPLAESAAAPPSPSAPPLEIATAQTYVQQMLTAAMTDGGVNHEEQILTAKRRLEALNLKKSASPISRKKAREFNDRGLKYLQIEQVDEAIEAFHEAYQADRSDVEIIENLGYAYLRKGLFSAAEPLLLRALMFAPGRTSAWANLGQNYANQGNHAAAVACFANAYRFSRNQGVTRQFLERLTGDANGQVAAAATQALQLPFLQGGQGDTGPEKVNAKLFAPMTFSRHDECSGSGCSSYVLAEGTITPDVPERFLQFMKTHGGVPTIYFNSPGGNLMAGLKLGTAIRGHGLNTFVGGPYESSRFKKYTASDPVKGAREYHDEVIEQLVKNGVCFSACSYAFLGGISRELGKGGLLGVHQFYGGKGDTGESLTQLTMTVLANYLEEMGIDRHLLDIASLTPSGKIETLSIERAQELNVDNTNPPKGEWHLETTRGGELFAYVMQKLLKKNAVVSLYLSRYHNDFLGTIRFVIKQKFRSNREILEALGSDNNAWLVKDNHGDLT